MVVKEHPKNNKINRLINQLQDWCRQVQGGSEREDFMEYGSRLKGADTVILIHLENLHLIWVLKNYFSWFSRKFGAFFEN